MPDIWDVAEREHPSPASLKELLRVVVVDFDMKFASMVGFMVKWVIASIPAALTLVLLAIGFWIVGSACSSCSGGSTRLRSRRCRRSSDRLSLHLLPLLRSRHSSMV